MNHDDMEESDTQASIEEVEGQRPSSISISTRCKLWRHCYVLCSV